MFVVKEGKCNFFRVFFSELNGLCVGIEVVFFGEGRDDLFGLRVSGLRRVIFREGFWGEGDSF